MAAQSVTFGGAPVTGTVADTARYVTNAIGDFFGSLAQVRLGYLAAALALFGIYVALRSRISWNAVRAAYPGQEIAFRRIWAAYIIAYGLNGVVPAGGGNVAQLVLSKNAVARSRYTAVSVALCTVLVVDTLLSIGTLAYAFTQSAFPRPGNFVALDSFDVSFLARNFDAVMLSLTIITCALLIAYAWAAARYERFKDDVVRGTAILRDRVRFTFRMLIPQLVAYAAKIACYWLMLDAFGIGGSLSRALLVAGAQYIASIVPFTPGGLGATQALLVVIFAGAASDSTVAAYSVGQQLALLAFTLILAFISAVTVFHSRSLRGILRETRAQHAAEVGVERALDPGERAA